MISSTNPEVNSVISNLSGLTLSRTERQRTPELTELDMNDQQAIVSVMQRRDFKPHEFSSSFHAAPKIAEIFQTLPVTTRNRLKAVLVTHEENGLTYHGGKSPMSSLFGSYSFHIIFLGKTCAGLKVIDFASPEAEPLSAKEWIKGAIVKEDLTYALINRYTMNYLPQFRFMESDTYCNSLSSELAQGKCLTMPNNAINNESAAECAHSHVWNHSFFLNMYETYQLFTGEWSYSEAIGHHQVGLNLPLDRLTDDDVHDLTRMNIS